MTTNMTRYLVLAIGILGSVQAIAQAGDRTLSGVITSPTGSPITIARLSIKNAANGDTKSVTVKSDGSYIVDNLPPGTYEITVSATRFADAHSTVAISSGGKRAENFVMRPGVAVEPGKGQVGSSTVKGGASTSISA